MEIILNGEKIEASGTIEILIKQKGYNPQNIVVIVNENILKREDWQNYEMKDGDVIEIISFVGGGSFIKQMMRK